MADYTRSGFDMQHVPGSGVPLYAIQKDGTLKQYSKVEVYNPDQMPSGGDFANPEADQPNVKGIEDKMISFFGNCLVEAKCKPENWVRGRVELHAKMLRAEHVDALAAALAKYEVANVYLRGNQLGPEGAAKLAEALMTNQTLKVLECVRPQTLSLARGKAPRPQPHPTAPRRLRPRVECVGSLKGNNLTDGGKDMSGVLKLAEAAKQSKLEKLTCAAARACSLARPRPLPRAACAPAHLACRRVCCRLGSNGLTEEAKQVVQEAAGPGVQLVF